MGLKPPTRLQFACKDGIEESVRKSIPSLEITERSGARRKVWSLLTCILMLPLVCSCWRYVRICCCFVGICMRDDVPYSSTRYMTHKKSKKIKGNRILTPNCDCTLYPCNGRERISMLGSHNFKMFQLPRVRPKAVRYGNFGYGTYVMMTSSMGLT